MGNNNSTRGTDDKNVQPELSTGAIVGIVFAVFVFILVVFLCIHFTGGVPGTGYTGGSPSMPYISISSDINISNGYVPRAANIVLLMKNKYCMPEKFITPNTVVYLNNESKNQQFTSYIANNYPEFINPPSITPNEYIKVINGIPIVDPGGYFYLNGSNDNINNIEALQNIASKVISLYSNDPVHSLVVFSVIMPNILYVQIVNNITSPTLTLSKGTRMDNVLFNAQSTIFGDSYFKTSFLDIPEVCNSVSMS